jgi:tetratricopeptide (TPR) repeat protein
MTSQILLKTSEWLKQVQSHQRDDRWLTGREEELFSVISDGLHSNPSFLAAVDLLLLVYPHYALVLCHVQRWTTLLFDALLEAQTLRDNEMQIRIFNYLGRGYVLNGKNSAAQDAFLIALDRAQQEQYKEMMLAAYIGLIRLMYVNVPQPIERNIVVEALELAHEVDNFELRIILYESLALIYSRSTESSDQAIGYAQTAYAYWYRLNNDLEMGRMAYLLTASYRLIGRLDQAGLWLERTAANFEKTDFQRQYTLLAHEQGTLYLLQKQYEQAIQWLELSLREAVQIGSKEYMASAYHDLGLTYIYLEQYDVAEENLMAAIPLWAVVEDYYEQSNTHEAMGYVEYKRGNLTEAKRWLDLALTLCQQIPQENQRAHRQKMVREQIDEIFNNTGSSISG